MKSVTRKSLGMAIVTALAAVGLVAFASPAGAYAPAPIPKLQPTCPTSTTLTGNPLGVFFTPTDFDRYQLYQAHVGGWAIDPSAGSGPIDVRVDLTIYRRNPLDGSIWIDRPVSITTTANLVSYDPALLCWGLGYQHRFDVWWTEVGGGWITTTNYSRIDACVTALNVGWGRDTSLGCQTVWGG